LKVTVRQKHSHVSPTHKEERCDAALLIAAGDLLALALTGLHLKQPEEGEWECNGCDAADALAKWKKATDE
jgi:hypothetical protein